MTKQRSSFRLWYPLAATWILSSWLSIPLKNWSMTSSYLAWWSICGHARSARQRISHFIDDGTWRWIGPYKWPLDSVAEIFSPPRKEAEMVPTSRITVLCFWDALAPASTFLAHPNYNSLCTPPLGRSRPPNSHPLAHCSHRSWPDMMWGDKVLYKCPA